MLQFPIPQFRFHQRDFNMQYTEAEEGVPHDSDYPGLVYEWMTWILKGVQAAGDTERIKETAESANSLP
jgi:hypothetical protein